MKKNCKAVSYTSDSSSAGSHWYSVQCLCTDKYKFTFDDMETGFAGGGAQASYRAEPSLTGDERNRLNQ